MTSYIFTVYIPAAMIVFLSTVSFWVRPGSVPARVALGITTVLSEATVMSGALNAYPTVSYLKALDLYTMVCFCFTFCVLIEYAIVHIMVNKKMYHHHQDHSSLVSYSLHRLSCLKLNLKWHSSTESDSIVSPEFSSGGGELPSMDERSATEKH